MKATNPGYVARIELLLAELRLPAIKQVWTALAAQADKEGWPAARFALAEYEIAERARRRLERHLAEARLPPGKTLDTFDFEAVPVISKAQVMAFAAGDARLNNGANLLLFGRRVAAKVTWRQLSASPWSKAAGACCSLGRPISSSVCKSPVASSR